MKIIPNKAVKSNNKYMLAKPGIICYFYIVIRFISEVHMDPYKNNMFKENPYAEKTVVEGRLCVILRGRIERRGLILIPQPSRCFRAGDVHELIICDEEGAKPGTEANRIAYLGFVDITRGGVVIAGDEIYCGDKLIGTVAGFDEAHMPNHINIVLYNPERQTGVELGVELDSPVKFIQKQ